MQTTAQMNTVMTQKVCRNGDRYGLLTADPALN